MKRMKKNLVIIFCFVLSKFVFGQSLDFGVEVQQNNNQVKKWTLNDNLSNVNLAFTVLDNNDDSLNVYFNQFSMTNNFEIPLYFRINTGPRFFADFKISSALHTLNMEGVSRYNDNYYITNYGTYDDFSAQAQLNGFDSVDVSDYDNYINAIKTSDLRSVRSTEQFRTLGFTLNLGYRFLPHRSFKPYITAGYTVKAKYRKFTYQYLEFSNPNVFDYNKVNEGVNKFSEITNYINIGIGLEFYRFRAGLYYQGGLAFTPATGNNNDVVVYVSPFTQFERIHSYGFSICANLFSTPIGKRVIQDDLGENEIVLSNIERKKIKWEFEARFNRRLFNEVSTFYANPENRLSIMSRDSILFNTGTEIKSAEKIEVFTLGDVKRIQWSGQFDIAVRRYFGRRFSVEAAVGFSNLTTDIESREFTATIIHDATGNYYAFDANQPRINAGAYRAVFSLTNFALTLNYKIIDRELFSFSILTGTGYTDMLLNSLAYAELPKGVHELETYDTFNRKYYSSGNTGLFAHQGNLEINLDESPEEFLNDFGNTPLDDNWATPKPNRFGYPMVKLGFVTTIDRFTLGLSVDRSRDYMDGFILNQYNSIYFSVGYIFKQKVFK